MALIGLPELVVFLEKLLYSDDEDIADAAREAMGMLEDDEFSNNIDEEDYR